ncbi:MAG: hypothetical protein IT385_00455 [Deltaproteobacteria bacterium]|nr:hypothetical protein [Deltaproteobacteria bacterium]
MDDSKKPSGEPPVGAWGVPAARDTLRMQNASGPSEAPPGDDLAASQPVATPRPPEPRAPEPTGPLPELAEPLSARPPEAITADEPRIFEAPLRAADAPARVTTPIPEAEGGAAGRGRGRGWLWLVFLAAAVGAWFSAVSTADFVEHLDGQTHAIHCSVSPVASESDASSGCLTAMFSPWSSLFRTSVWGGVPIALLSFGVFAFLAALALGLAFARRVDRRDTLFLLLATLVPVGASAVYGTISATKLGTFCTMCVGIYVASGLVFLLALVGHLRASRGDGPLPWGRWALWFGQGVLVVGALFLLYMGLVPSERPSVDQGCGALVEEPSEETFVLSLPSEAGAVPALEILDPLCSSCKALDERLAASGFDKQLARKVVVFPLDTCVPNDVTRQRTHPGACTVSYAMLCAPGSAHDILAYAFAEQERLLELGKTNEAALKADLEQRFPAVKGCIGSAKVKAELTKIRKWAARNAIELRTPQLMVAGTRVCPQNEDLGLEFTLTRMLARARGQQP